MRGRSLQQRGVEEHCLDRAQAHMHEQEGDKQANLKVTVRDEVLWPLAFPGQQAADCLLDKAPLPPLTQSPRHYERVG